MNIPENIQLFSFIDGLTPKMQQHVLSFKPESLNQAIELARTSYDVYNKNRENVVKVNYMKPRTPNGNNGRRPFRNFKGQQNNKFGKKPNFNPSYKNSDQKNFQKTPSTNRNPRNNNNDNNNNRKNFLL